MTSVPGEQMLSRCLAHAQLHSHAHDMKCACPKPHGLSRGTTDHVNVGGALADG